MMIKRISILIFIGLFSENINLLAQPSPIGLGWAKNSVNAVVFRKNSVVTFNGIQYTAYYDSTGHVVLAKRTIGTNDWKVKQTSYTGNINDAHCSISIIVDGDGYLHIAWNHHNNSLHYCKSIEPDTFALTNEMSMIDNSENDVTYPEFFKLPNGNLIFMYRYGVSGSGNCVINKYNLSEKKWERLHDVLIDGEGQRNAYWQSCVDALGTIHVSWVWRETWDVASNHDMCYAKSTDNGVTWQKSTGEIYTIPITAATAEYAAKIPQKSELINQTSMFADSHGRPYITTYYTPKGTNIPQFHLIYLDSTGWNTKQITNRITAFSLSGGGTKKIPISRPQIIANDSKEELEVYLIYRDIERDSKVSVNKSINLDSNIWEVYDLTDFSVENWEPTYDTELWKDSSILNIFVQKVGQGDSEGLESLPAQPVYILEMNSELQPADTIIIETTEIIEDDTSDTGIKVIKNNSFFIFPNPANDEININKTSGVKQISLININGKRVLDYFENPPSNIDIGQLPTGIYFVQISGNNLNEVHKFIKNKNY